MWRCADAARIRLGHPVPNQTRGTYRPSLPRAFARVFVAACLFSVATCPSAWPLPPPLAAKPRLTISALCGHSRGHHPVAAMATAVGGHDRGMATLGWRCGFTYVHRPSPLTERVGRVAQSPREQPKLVEPAVAVASPYRSASAVATLVDGHKLGWAPRVSNGRWCRPGAPKPNVQVPISHVHDAVEETPREGIARTVSRTALCSRSARCVIPRAPRTALWMNNRCQRPPPTMQSSRLLRVRPKSGEMVVQETDHLR